MEGVGADAAEEGRIACVAFSLRHEVDFDSFNWAENYGLEEPDTQPCEQLEHLFVVLHAPREHLLVKVGQTNHQWVTIGVLEQAARQIGHTACVETMEYALACVYVLGYGYLVLKVWLRLPLCLD